MLPSQILSSEPPGWRGRGWCRGSPAGCRLSQPRPAPRTWQEQDFRREASQQVGQILASSGGQCSPWRGWGGVEGVAPGGWECLGELAVHPGGEDAGRQVLVDHRPLVAVHPQERPGPAVNMDVASAYLVHMCIVFRENANISVLTVSSTFLYSSNMSMQERIRPPTSKFSMIFFFKA